MDSPEIPNLLFDYIFNENLSLPGGDLPPLDPPGLTWQSHSLTALTPPSGDLDDAFANYDGLEDIVSRKRFLELASILDYGRHSKIDKVAVLGDAVRMVNQLRMEAQKLKDSNEEMREKINELKAEKNELREEKLRLKTEKDRLEVKIKSTNAQSGFFHSPLIMPALFSGQGQVVGSKLVPFMGYPGVSMWQFMPPTAVDTSQDHVMRSPAA